MTPEAETYWRKMLNGLVRAIGKEAAAGVAMEVSQRMGSGGTNREWTVMLIKVLTEFARARGYTGSVVALVAAMQDVEAGRRNHADTCSFAGDDAPCECPSAVGSAVAPSDPEP